MIKKFVPLLAVALSQVFASPAFAQSHFDTGNTAWMLTSSALVFLMTIPGVALLYAGFVRKKNAISIAMQVFITVCVVTVAWAVIGYSLAFTHGGTINDFIGGLDKLALKGVFKNSPVGTIPESVYIMFQLAFACITVALITGAFAERIKFTSFVLFILLWTFCVYVPIVHWVWGGGFLAKREVLDFAGGTVVHINAGTAGLVCAIALGKRYNFGRERMEAYNPILALTGTAFLWIGWFGFNAGSAIAANASAGMAMLVTQIAAAAAALTWMFTEAAVYRRISVIGVLSGSIAGLVAITPGSGYVDPLGALVIGLMAGLLCFLASTVIKRMLKYDDPMDVFGVHAVGGITGSILTGVFATKSIGNASGLIDGNPMQVFIQFQGVMMTIIWSACMTLVILLIVNLITGLRVNRKTELEGLDIHMHGEALS
ncbi:MAG: ammonium transporter [Alphaproteobacteria bacterium]